MTSCENSDTNMSARVWNPMAMEEIAMLRSPALVQKPRSSTSYAARVKRNLFGTVDTQESKIFIERQLAAQVKELSKKYDFDFVTGQPLQNHEQYQWERVPPTLAPACFTGITISRGAHVMSSSSTASEGLLDQRAERENGLEHQRYIPVSSTSVSGSDSESDCSFETVRTYPLVLRSETSAITAKAAVITSINVAKSNSSSFPASINRAKRQQRITDYLKERKRLSTSSPKSSAAKRIRQMEEPSSTSPSDTSMSLSSASVKPSAQ